VDYTSRADARRAFEALVHSTHLYGRRLVLEWAKEEESMEELRTKARERFR
jgi:multiple RNA-binding domain-containing protein 1